MIIFFFHPLLLLPFSNVIKCLLMMTMLTIYYDYYDYYTVLSKKNKDNKHFSFCLFVCKLMLVIMIGMVEAILKIYIVLKKLFPVNILLKKNKIWKIYLCMYTKKKYECMCCLEYRSFIVSTMCVTTRTTT